MTWEKESVFLFMVHNVNERYVEIKWFKPRSLKECKVHVVHVAASLFLYCCCWFLLTLPPTALFAVH